MLDYKALNTKINCNTYGQCINNWLIFNMNLIPSTY